MAKNTNKLVLETKYAGFWLRFVALIIDILIVFVTVSFYVIKLILIIIQFFL